MPLNPVPGQPETPRGPLPGAGKISLQTATEIPGDFDFNDEFRAAFDLLENTRRNAVITGKAGTGKSTLLQYFRGNTKKNIAVLAPTGVAAIKIHGQTIHSFFRFPARFISPAHIHRLKKKELFEKLDAVVIDEASMVRADLMDGMDHALRVNRGRMDKPFGGAQVILFADLFQLPPVVEKGAAGIVAKQYATPYFFSAGVFREAGFANLELTKIYRQKNDAFIRLLNKVRENKLSAVDLAALNARVDAGAAFGLKGVITVTATNRDAALINEGCLARIPHEEFQYRADIGGTFEPDACPAEECLRLKKQAQVMMLKNDRNGRWVNGTIAEIYDLDRERVRVSVEGRIHDVALERWEKIEYSFNPEERRIEEKVVGTFEQFPLKPAWAITIHKSQGQTFERVIIHLGDGAFAHGQTYVALSRCTSLEGIKLKKPLTFRDIICDPRVYGFYASFKGPGSNPVPGLWSGLADRAAPSRPPVNPPPNPAAAAVTFKPGDRIRLKYDRQWTGEVVRVEEQEGRPPAMVVKLDNYFQERRVRAVELEPEKGSAPAAARYAIECVFTGDADSDESCVFDIRTQDAAAADTVFRINQWTSDKVRLEEAVCRLKILPDHHLELAIEGGGRDNRCRWCRTFRSALQTACIKRFGPGSYTQNGFCKHE